MSHNLVAPALIAQVCEQPPEDADNHTIIWHRLTEENDREGETWYHYFKDDGKGKVVSALEHVLVRPNPFSELEVRALSWREAEVLANVDHHTYMDEYWFGDLVDFKGLAAATDQDLYKGKIRNFGEELFTREEE